MGCGENGGEQMRWAGIVCGRRISSSPPSNLLRHFSINNLTSSVIIFDGWKEAVPDGYGVELCNFWYTDLVPCY